MNNETHYHSDHIHPQLPCNHFQVSDWDDLSTDEAGNTDRRVPDGKHRIFSFSILNWRILISRMFSAEQSRGKVWQCHWMAIMHSTYHIIAPTSLITISFRTLKNSSISLAFSPIFPMITPKATKNPIRPVIQTKADEADVFLEISILE